MLKVIHHPNCTKCIGLLEYLKSNQIPYEHRDYIESPLGYTEIEAVLKVLQLRPLDIIRQNESLFQEQFAGHEKTDAAWIQVLADHPSLLQRPILMKDGQATIGRPLEKAFAFVQPSDKDAR